MQDSISSERNHLNNKISQFNILSETFKKSLKNNLKAKQNNNYNFPK